MADIGASGPCTVPGKGKSPVNQNPTDEEIFDLVIFSPTPQPLPFCMNINASFRGVNGFYRDEHAIAA